MTILGLDDAVNDAMGADVHDAPVRCRGVADDGVGFVALTMPGCEALRLTLPEAEALRDALADAVDAAAVLAGGLP